MLSSKGKLTNNEEIEPQPPESNTSRELIGDREQIFSLIDSLLSLEACLFLVN